MADQTQNEQQNPGGIILPFSIEELQSAVDLARRITGQNTSFTDPVISPQTPTVTGLKISSIANYLAGTLFTLTWNDVPASNQPVPVAYYNVYAKGQAGLGAQALTLVSAAANSPAKFFVNNINAGTLTFIVQTVLFNGKASDPNASPSVVASIAAGSQQQSVLFGSSALILSNFTFTDNSPGAGQIAWSTGQVTYKGITYNVAAGNTSTTQPFVYWQTSTPTVFTPSTAPPPSGVNDFIVAMNAGGLYSPATSMGLSSGARAVVFGNGIFMLNKNGHYAGIFTMGSTSVPGQIGLYDGTGAGGLDGTGQQILVDGSIGKVRTNNVELNSASWGLQFANAALSATTATAGANGAVPAQVVGYFLVLDSGGVTRKIPYFAN